MLKGTKEMNGIGKKNPEMTEEEEEDEEEKEKRQNPLLFEIGMIFKDK